MESHSVSYGPRRVVLNVYEPKDDTVYKLCPEVNHYHNIPETFQSCYQPGCWTWESRYSR